jgi:sugar phosphate isomerase/epimerase
MGKSMIKPGLVSVTFRQLSVVEVAQWAYRASLTAIEWGGDIHVPHGDIEKARQARKLTAERGLAVSSYGSYYRLGESENKGLSFDAVLDTALELETEMIRVWAGSCGSAECTASQRAAAADDARRICELAEVAGVTVALEYHGKTLTDTLGSALQFLKEVDQPNLKTYWQPRTGAALERNLAELKAILPYLANVHVFQWTRGQDGKTIRQPLVEGSDEWREYLKALPIDDRERYALLEFVRDDRPEQLFEDADCLREILEEV